MAISQPEPRAAKGAARRSAAGNRAAEINGPASEIKTLVLGSEVDIVGSVYIDGNVRMEAGAIDGEIRCSELTILKRARVRGRIVAEIVTIYGSVADGSIYADLLVLKPGCNVEAEIYHRQLQLEQGSYFDGKSRRVDDPAALAPA